MIPIGTRRHVVVLQNPGAAVPDGDGGYTQTYSDLSPRTWHVSIEPATARDLERITAGTVISMTSHVVKGPYRSDVTTQTRILFGARVLNIVGLTNPEERNIDLIAVCAEVVT